MRTICDIKDTFNRAIKQYYSLLSIYNDEVKDYGEPKENTIKLFNALYIQLDKATEYIENGLKGKFPWE